MGMAQRVRVTSVGEVSPGTMRVFEVNGRRLLIANVEGVFFALSNQCPHREAPLDQGWLRGNVIECPWHHYRYDVRTGENLYPRNVYPADLTYLERDLQPIQQYVVQVEGEDVFVEV